MSYIGIDLGTTNSCVAVWTDGSVEIIANDLGSRTTPSWVAFTDDDRIVGSPAVRQFIRNAKNTVFDVKWLIGRDCSDPTVKTDIKRWPFTVVEIDGGPRIQVEYKRELKKFAPEEISAMVLEKMKETAEKYLDCEVRGAVITVPAYFTNAQRQATMDAGEIAGLEVLGIINEPTAAALAYGYMKKRGGGSNVLIYDLGGGTFDVSIVKIAHSEISVLACAGDTHLGGGDFDALLVNYLAEEFERKHGVTLKGNVKAMCRLKLKAEETKVALSSQVICSVDIDCLHGSEDFSTKISRATFESLCKDMIRSTLVHVEDAIREAKLSRGDIDEVVLVGGSTRIPMVQELLQGFFLGQPLKMTVNPDEVVAYGAAIQASILSGTSDIKFNNLIKDITSHSLGINTVGQVMTVVIPRNTQVPCCAEKTFVTSRDRQIYLNIVVVEGEEKYTKDNHFLGSFVLKDIPPAPTGMTSALVTFDLDANGILKVTAVEKVTGKSGSIEIHIKDKGLTSEEIQRMRKDAERYRTDDEYQRSLAVARNKRQYLNHFD